MTLDVAGCRQDVMSNDFKSVFEKMYTILFLFLYITIQIESDMQSMATKYK